MTRIRHVTTDLGHDIHRREFLSLTAAAATTAIVPSSALGKSWRAAPSERIRVGVVGLGSRGFNLIDALLGEPDAQIVAVCDVDSMHYRDRPWGQGTAYGRDPAKKRIEDRYAKQSATGRSGGVSVYSDFRELIARDDINAVIVATPDHWHALVALTGLRAGKDVYCEKPLAHRFSEGQAICRERAKCNAVFQVGSQQRLGAEFRKAVELVLDGHIGKVHTVEVLPSVGSMSRTLP